MIGKSIFTNLLKKRPHKTVHDMLDKIYPDDSAGRMMTTEYIGLRKFMTVAESLAHIKRTGIHKETIYTCYVTEQRKLLGIVSTKDLMISDDDLLIENLMKTEIISVHTHTDQEEVAHLFDRYNLLALPVLDALHTLVGIVTLDDALDVMIDETTEDITKMAAVNPSERPYFETSVFRHVRNRIVWLLILMFSATITGSIIAGYESAIAAVPLLVSFIPVLMDTGGNGGSQTSALIIRGLALNEIHFSDLPRVIFKEFRISILVGIPLALANGLRIIIINRNLLLALAVSISLVGVVTVSKMIGSVLPLCIKKIGLDPAVMATPFITTIVDTISMLMFFGIAARIFGL
ncbi:MAG: magnesium transporter [Lachnospiraceae bacterium]|nr:magnesium transporter [Lachnospiraceae bacterium]